MTKVPNLSAEITSLFIGKIEDRWPNKQPSAIGKKSTAATLCLEANGFTEDEQADLQNHGGLEKAVHHYSADHMKFWRKTFPEFADTFEPGCFGENISTVGLNEQNLCLGDVLTIGSAKVEICQGRQPCWKLNLHTGIGAMAASFQKTAYTGWYYRVLENGEVKTGDTVRLIGRTIPNWTLERLTKARFNPKLSIDEAKELSECQPLSQSWREAFQKKMDLEYAENTDLRLTGKL